MALHEAGKIDNISVDYFLDDTRVRYDILPCLANDQVSPHAIERIVDGAFSNREEQVEQQSDKKFVVPTLRDLCIVQIVREQSNHLPQ